MGIEATHGDFAIQSERFHEIGSQSQTVQNTLLRDELRHVAQSRMRGHETDTQLRFGGLTRLMAAQMHADILRPHTEFFCEELGMSGKVESRLLKHGLVQRTGQQSLCKAGQQYIHRRIQTGSCGQPAFHHGFSGRETQPGQLRRLKRYTPGPKSDNSAGS